MAKNPCVYTLNGKTYSEAEFKAHILEGNLDDVLGGYFAPKEPKEKALLNRAFKGDNPEAVKAAVEKHGLTYEPESRAKARQNAKDFIAEVGEDAALEAVRRSQVDDGAAAYIWAEAIDNVGNKLAEATDAAEVQRLTDLQAKLISEFDAKARSGGRFISALDDIYERSNFNYNLDRQVKKYKELNKGEISPEVEAKFKELDEKLKDVQKRLAEAEKRVDAQEAEVAKAEKKTYSERAKKVADKVRTLKTKPFEFKDRDGNVIKLTKMSAFDWNELVENAAQAIEKAGSIADGVSVVIDNIKDSDWYKALTEGDKDRFASELGAYFEGKEAARTEAAKKRTEKSIGQLEEKLAKEDYTKPKRKPIIADTELTKLRAEKARLQEQFDKEMYKAELKNRDGWQKAKDHLADAWGLLRLFKATGEFSFLGVQGLVQAVAHPTYAYKGLKQALNNFSSEAKTEKFLNEIKAQDYYSALVDSKLALTKPDAKLTAREELFYSGYTDLVWNTIGNVIGKGNEKAGDKWKEINPFKAFERAAVGYLDTVRIERFLDGMQMLEMQGKKIESHPEDYKAVADLINTLTGRASLGKRGERIADGLTLVLFSPRNWASMLKTASPYAAVYFGRLAYKSPTAAKMALRDYGTFVGLTTAMVTMVAAALENDDDPETYVERDPTNSDFGKIKLGDRIIDPWGGRIQQVILTSRMIQDSLNKTEKGNREGKDYALGTPYKAPTRGELLLQQAFNKLSPSSAVAKDILFSKVNKEGVRVDPYGKEFTWSDQLNPTPITYQTIYDLYKDDPSAVNGLLAFYAFFGGGVDVREEKPEKEKKKAAPRKSVGY